jgi:hypothetical protein
MAASSGEAAGRRDRDLVENIDFAGFERRNLRARLGHDAEGDLVEIGGLLAAEPVRTGIAGVLGVVGELFERHVAVRNVLGDLVRAGADEAGLAGFGIERLLPE